MAHLASAGSHAINGVAALHTELLKQTVLCDFYRVSPGKFFNVTNGVTPRRWMVLSNPRLSELVTGRIGDAWIADLEDHVRRIEPLADDRGFQAEWQAVKAANKWDLTRLIKEGLPAHKIGRAYRFDLIEVDAWFRTRDVESRWSERPAGETA